MSARLNAEIAEHGLVFDAAQVAAAARLDALGTALRRRPASIVQRLRLRWPWPPGGTTPGPRGLYLWGGVGRGKTLLMDLFVASLQARSAGIAPVRVERVHYYRFMQAVHARLNGIKRQERPLHIVARDLAARMRVLCLDEFFVSDIADAMLLAGLLEGLFEHGVTLVTTSNLPPQDLYKDGLQRQRFLPAIELLQTHVEVLHLEGGVDYRLRQLEQAPTYLDSGEPGTASAFQRRFAALAGGSATGPLQLTIEGRLLQAVNSGPGLVWFEFGELCDGPRSQNDYIELARLYHTIFIAHIPRFDAEQDNAARRFVTLIDELYDRGVNLVVSAAAAPQRLYRGDRLRFEFERTASRLIEMQTQHYLAGGHRP